MTPEADAQDALPPNKISPEFSARLQRLHPHEKIRVVLLIDFRRSSRSAPAPRQSYAERQAAIARTREAAQHAMGEIAAILGNFEGHSLVQAPDALGTLPVEVSAAGVQALASSGWIKAILEDQPLRSPLPPARAAQSEQNPIYGKLRKLP